MTNNIIKNKLVIRVVAFSLVALTVMTYSLTVTGAQVAYNVKYGSRKIATVKNISDFDSAVKIVEDRLDCDAIEGRVELPSCEATLVLSNVIDSTEVVAEKIIETSKDIVTGQTLKINGEEVASAVGNEISIAVEALKTKYTIADAECQVVFEEDVEISEKCFFADEIINAKNLEEQLSKLTVKTFTTVVTDEEIPFKTITKRSPEHMVGFRYTIKTGSVGIRRHTQNVTYVNGVEVSRQTLSTEEISSPVNQEVLVGSAKTQATYAEKAAAYASGFIFPLPSGSWIVTAYWGDGRNHKGMDLAAKRNTYIYAVADGVVTYSGYKSDYGHMVTIDHGNSLKTVYAHANERLVSVGDKVSAGDVIALVGTTGISTGNHLHFEVYRGGVRVDPAPYIGLD